MRHVQRWRSGHVAIGLLTLLALGPTCAKTNKYQPPDPERADSSADAKETGTGGSEAGVEGPLDGPSSVEADATSDGLSQSDAPDPLPTPTQADARSCDSSSCDERVKDGCCPSSCNSKTDMDCSSSCGNGVIESGEECDPPGSCPTTCAAQGCTTFTLQGSASLCNARCVQTAMVAVCANGDACCPASCFATNDSDCAAKCDNGVKEAAETCDPLASCPTTCPPQGCQLRKVVNPGTCTASCVNDRQQTACASGDGCCPGGCDSTKDGDCPVVCGNGTVEAGETCDPVSQCNQRQAACKSDRDNVRTPMGSPSTCTFACVESKRACGPPDGQCPSSCGTTSNDPDCKRADGAACDQNMQCQNNFCVDRVCCSSRCDGQCEGCSNAVTGKTSGTCAPVRAGMDPRSDCSDAGRETCGNDGTCDGAGGCRKYATNTTCGAATCSSDQKSEISERKCDGSGNCFPPSSTACGAGEACEGTRCVSTCGQMDQPCCEQLTCKGGLTCLTLTDRIRCGRCGGLGQICCNGPTGPTCSEGDCFAYPTGAVCENCGKRGQRCCKPNDSCTEGTCMGLTVRQCF
jgi:hypothetical protein